MKQHYCLRKSVGAVMAVNALLCAPVYAQSESNSTTPQQTMRLEEIVVTAQKRVESIQDVPVSISVVSGSTIANEGITDSVEMSKMVPSMYINNTLVSGGVVIRIRGFGFGGSDVIDSDVATYLDGANVPRPGAAVSSFLDIDSVEVLNGPQGTLFGRNAAMGALSIRTKSPSLDEASFDLEFEGENYDSYAAKAIGNLPVSDDFAVRFAVKGSTTDGIYDNRLDGKTYGANDKTVARLSTLWNLTDDLSWTLRVDHSKTDGDGANPLAVFVKGSGQFALQSFSDWHTSRGLTQPVYSSEGSHTFNQFFGNPFLDDEQLGVNSHLAWDLSNGLTLQLISSYRDWTNDQLTPDSQGSALDLFAVGMLHDSESMSHELQLVSPKGAYMGGKLGFTAGLYYFEEDYEFETTFNVGSQYCVDFIGSVAPPPLVGACLSGPRERAGIEQTQQTAESLAVYTTLNFQITPELELNLGYRYTADDKTGTFLVEAPNPIVAIVGIVTPPGVPDQDFDDSNSSWQASLSWNVSSDIMLFATYSTGYKAGGWSAYDFLESETVKDIELGVKSILWDGRLRLNATAYDTQLEDFHGRGFDGISFVVRNAGDVQSRGIDIDGEVLITDNTVLSFGVTYLDAEYADAKNAPPLLDSCSGLPGCLPVQDLTGEPLDHAPEYKGSLGLKWTSAPFANGYSARVLARYSFTDGFLTSNNNSPQSEIDGWETTDLSVSLLSPEERWQVDLYGKNIFDESYFVSTVPKVGGFIYGTDDPVAGTTLYSGWLGAPVTYGIRLKMSF